MMLQRLIGFLSVIVLNGCGAPAASNPVGTYSFRSREVQETLELKPDGTFTQSIQYCGENYSKSGRWELGKDYEIMFYDFLARYDALSQKTIKPKEYSFHDGYWDPIREVIVLDDQDNYFLKRM